jgi:hypothetical protein
MNLTHCTTSYAYFRTGIAIDTWAKVLARYDEAHACKLLRIRLQAAALDLATNPEAVGGSEAKPSPSSYGQGSSPW